MSPSFVRSLRAILLIYSTRSRTNFHRRSRIALSWMEMVCDFRLVIRYDLVFTVFLDRMESFPGIGNSDANCV